MNHLREMCCASCAEKLALIEARAYADEPGDFDPNMTAITDRRELLGMVEQLLRVVADNRAALRMANELLFERIEAEGNG